MIKRCVLFLGKNTRKIASNFVIVTLILFIMNVTIYLIDSLDALKYEERFIEYNVLPDYEKMFSGSEYNSESMISYSEIYDEISGVDDLKSYRIDIGNYTYFDVDNTLNNTVLLPIYDDRHTDFVRENAKLIKGSIDDTGLVISEEYAQNFGVGIGDKISFATYFDSSILYSYDNGVEEIDATEAKLFEIEIVGIYATSDYSSLVDTYSLFSDSDFYGPFYIGERSLYNMNEVFREYFSSSFSDNDELMMFDNPFVEPQPLERFFAEFATESSGSEFEKYILSNCEVCSALNSTSQIEEVSKPITKLKSSILTFGTSIVLISLIALYLNYYLLLEKRVNEIISLVSFGVSNTMLGLQAVIEMLIIVILASPVAFIAFKYSINPIVNILEKYYYIVVSNSLETSNNVEIFIYGSLPYLELDVKELVSLNEPNLFTVVLLSFLITVSLIVISSVFEMSRRIKLYIKK